MAAVALPIILAACSNEELQPTYATDTDAVQVEATVCGLRAQAAGEDDGSVWQDGDCFKATNTTAGATAGKEQAVFTYDGGAKTFLLSGTAYMIWADGDNSFQAYYPYSTGKSGDSFDSFTLPDDQNGKDKIRQSDYMTADTTAARTDSTRSISLDFHHQLAMVTVTVDGYNNEFTETSRPTIAKATFTVPATVQSSKNINVENASKEINGWVKTGKTFVAILPPGNYKATDTFLKLEDATGGTHFTILANSPLLTDGFKPGHAYTFNLTVGKNAATISSVNVAEWTVDNLPGGIAEEE